MKTGHLHHAPQQVRIIGGRWHRTPLAVIHKPGLRPTPARVRETLFNWLGQDLTGWHCADVFAGSGALGLEAASRGAASVHLFERDPQACASLERSAAKLLASDRTHPIATLTPLQLIVRQTEGVQALMQMPEQSLDVIFCDPPFRTAQTYVIALTAAFHKVLRPHGCIYLELPRDVDVAAWLQQEAYIVRKSLHAGQVQALLLQRGAPHHRSPRG